MLPYAGPALYVSGCLPEVVPYIVKIDLSATTSNPDEKNENDRQTEANSCAWPWSNAAICHSALACILELKTTIW